MHYPLTIDVPIGETGLVLGAQCYDRDGLPVGGLVSAGFHEAPPASGYYGWTHDFPAGFRGRVVFRTTTDATTLATVQINPAEVENPYLALLTYGVVVAEGGPSAGSGGSWFADAWSAPAWYEANWFGAPPSGPIGPTPPPTALSFRADASLPSAFPATADHYVGAVLTFVGGPNATLGRKIADFDQTTDTFTMAVAFPQAPAGGDPFVILGRVR